MKNLFLIFTLLFGLGSLNAQYKPIQKPKSGIPAQKANPTTPKQEAEPATPAQAKPTKEETIEYIKSTYLKKIYQGATLDFKKPGYEPNYTSASGDILVDKIDIKNDSLYIEYRNSVEITIISKTLGVIKNTEKNNYKLKLALKDVESINCIYFPRVGTINIDKADDAQIPMYINFQAAKDKNVFSYNRDNEVKQENSVSIPAFTVSKSNFNNFDCNQTQLYKAFNHLRKLCGAVDPPKPLQFD